MNMDILEKARAFAAEKHKDKRRKYSDQPYFNHLQSVANRIQGNGTTDPTVLAAAYLHDTVEDTDTSMKEVIEEFGADIAELVYWLTDAEHGNREARNLISSWRLARAPMQAKIIKFADIIDNAISISEHDPGFFKIWAAEKRAILTRMLEFEGSSLYEHNLFQQAWKNLDP